MSMSRQTEAMVLRNVNVGIEPAICRVQRVCCYMAKHSSWF